jgi:hypothetical protein
MDCLVRAIAALALVCIPFSPALSAEHPGSPTSRAEGRVLGPDGKTAVAGAVVRIVHLDSGKVFEAPVTKSDGRYLIERLPYGYYEFTIEAGGILHAAGGLVSLEPARARKYDLRLLAPAAQTAGSDESAQGAAIPGLDRVATGSAEIVGLTAPPGFFKTRTGLSVLIVGGVLLLLLVR